MAAVNTWRFTLFTKTVMGFVASSLHLAASRARLGAAQRLGQAHASDPNARDQEGGIEWPGFEMPIQRAAPQHSPQERRRVDRGNDALSIAGPANWRRTYSAATRTTEYCTRNLQAGVASFVVPPPVAFAGTMEEFQGDLLRRISERMPVVEGSTKTGTAGSFEFVSCVMQPAWGAARHITLYTALWAGKGQFLLFGADCEQLFHDNVLFAHALVQKIVLPVQKAPG